ncbi:MAG: Tad domain-containing protein [Acidobacteria bacterium]|nr:Tad domain-containing protein [Acidobacteriota bacterium]
MRQMFARAGSERGAVLVQVAIALIGLTALSAFVIDYGVMWVSRRQAQNSADAGALSGAISMGFVDMEDQDLARQSAINVAQQNFVWGEAPDITPGDVTFPVCPPGSPGAGTNSCIRVDVFRNQDRNNPLPTFFSRLAGITEQGVRATATAEVLFGESTDCVKPFAIADKWVEQRNDQGDVGWSEEDTFERYVQNGSNRGALLDPADYYEAPGQPGGTYAPNGTGFTRDSTALGGSDHGRRIVLKAGNPNQAIAPGWYHPVVINPTEGPGGANYRENIATCDPTVIGPGTVLQVEPGNMIGPTSQGIRDLIAQDPAAVWDPNMYGPGQGGVSGGCMATAACAISPRLVAIPVFNPDVYDAGRASGRIDITVVKVLGFFIDHMQGNDVIGYLSPYPSAPHGGTSNTPGAAFVVSIALVR